MKLQYNNWIKLHYPDHQSAINQCKDACEKIKNSFPELRITNGFILLANECNQRVHWWCVDEDGKTVDPTAHQYFGHNTIICDYEEINDDHDLRNYPQGRCPNCGDHYFVGKDNWHDSTVCSSKCWTAYARHINGQQ